MYTLLARYLHSQTCYHDFLLQVKRKYSYSAVGSTVQEDVDAANMGIMAKLKKLQKERLIVARLGFPDKAIEIDEHIEKIRADLRVSLFFVVCGYGSYRTTYDPNGTRA